MERKEAIEVIKKNYPLVFESGSKFETALRTLIPELVESEDEKIRKAISFIINNSHYKLIEYTGLTVSEMDAWLEKQGEHANFRNKIQVGDKVTRNEDGVLVNLSQLDRVAKPSIPEIVDEHFYEMLDDKIEPKFKIGDWIIFNGHTLLVNEVVQGYYRTISIGGIHNSYDWNIDNVARLWTIQDAKEGDVLYSQKGAGVEAIHLIRGWEKIPLMGNTLCSICTYRIKDNEIISGGIGAVWWECVKDKFTPATKEQHDLLFQKMKEAGYEWDAEKKELKKIEQKPVIMPKYRVGDIVRDIEDNEILTIKAVTKDKYIYTNDEFDWIKQQDVLELVKQKPTEWSEDLVKEAL